VYGEHYPCFGLVSAIPDEPGAPAPPDCTTLDEYLMQEMRAGGANYSGGGCSAALLSEQEWQIVGSHVLTKTSACFWSKQNGITLQKREKDVGTGIWGSWTTIDDDATIFVDRCTNCGHPDGLPEWRGRVEYISGGQTHTFSFFLPLAVEPVGSYDPAALTSSGRSPNGVCVDIPNSSNSRIHDFTFTVS
jgi:hypothetical protein